MAFVMTGTGMSNAVVGTACVTWQCTKYEFPEDDTVVSKHVGGV